MDDEESLRPKDKNSGSRTKQEYRIKRQQGLRKPGRHVAGWVEQQTNKTMTATYVCGNSLSSALQLLAGETRCTIAHRMVHDG